MGAIFFIIIVIILGIITGGVFFFISFPIFAIWFLHIIILGLYDLFKKK